MPDLDDFLHLLGSPDDPDGPSLVIGADELLGAGYRVPMVNGIPDFITHAPSTTRTLECPVPDVRKPPLHVLRSPPQPRGVPKWFTEKSSKWEPLHQHEKGWLLDIGAGHGNPEMYERLGYRYLGLDADPSGCHSFSWGRNKPSLNVLCDAHRLPFRSNSIQAINSTAVFEHLYNPPLAAREIARVLAPGGLLVGSCSFLEAEHFDSQFHMTALALYRLFSNAGLDVTAIYPAESLWHMHASAMFPGIPFAKFLASLVESTYFFGVRLKSREPILSRRLRLSAVLEFQAIKT